MHLRFTSLGAPVSQSSYTTPSVGQCRHAEHQSSAVTCLIRWFSLSKGSWSAAESQALFSRTRHNLNYCPPSFCSSLQPTYTCKSLSNLMCPLVSAFACQSEPTGFYHKELPICPCGLWALMFISTSTLSKHKEKLSPSDCSFDGMSGHLFTGPKLKLQDLSSETCGVPAKGSFLCRWRGQDRVWKCILARWTTSHTIPLETWPFLWLEL